MVLECLPNSAQLDYPYHRIIMNNFGHFLANLLTDLTVPLALGAPFPCNLQVSISKIIKADRPGSLAVWEEVCRTRHITTNKGNIAHRIIGRL